MGETPPPVIEMTARLAAPALRAPPDAPVFRRPLLRQKRPADGTINGRPDRQAGPRQPGSLPLRGGHVCSEWDCGMRRGAKRVAHAALSRRHHAPARRMATNSRSGSRRISSPTRAGPDDSGDPDPDGEPLAPSAARDIGPAESAPSLEILGGSGAVGSIRRPRSATRSTSSRPAWETRPCARHPRR